MLYERKYCDAKCESETFIKKKLRNVVVVVAATEWDNVLLEFLAQEANVALAMHSQITHGQQALPALLPG